MIYFLVLHVVQSTQLNEEKLNLNQKTCKNIICFLLNT